MDYTTRLDEKGQAHVNYSCPCGCDAGLIYTQETGTTEAGECCCGRILWVGGDAEAEVESRQEAEVEYELDVKSVTLPWGELVTAALAVPASTLAEERTAAGNATHDHGHGHDHEHGHRNDDEQTQTGGAEKVVDPVCGMTIDATTAAGKSEYQGKTYYFCATGCKAKFDADPQQYAGSRSLLDRIRGR